MRLIDADKLRHKDMNGGVVDIFDVLEAPTEDAIPIKWVNQFVIDICKSSHDDNLPAFLYWLDKMVAKWRKENDQTR